MFFIPAGLLLWPSLKMWLISRRWLVRNMNLVIIIEISQQLLKQIISWTTDDFNSTDFRDLRTFYNQEEVSKKFSSEWRSKLKFIQSAPSISFRYFLLCTFIINLNKKRGISKTISCQALGRTNILLWNFLHVLITP